MTRPTAAVLEAWIQQGWPHGRPPWDIAVFQEMWQAERRERAVEQAKDAQARELADLRRRVLVLERAVGRNGKALLDVICEAVGTTMGKFRREDRQRLLAEIEARGYTR
jgi:hypothetical protein